MTDAEKDYERLNAIQKMHLTLLQEIRQERNDDFVRLKSLPNTKFADFYLGRISGLNFAIRVVEGYWRDPPVSMDSSTD